MTGAMAVITNDGIHGALLCASGASARHDAPGRLGE